MALLCGIQLALDFGFIPFCCESDADSTVEQILSNVSSLSDVGLVVDDILSLTRDLQEFSVSWGRRSANSVAYSLPKFVLSLVSDCILLDAVPSSVSFLVSKDIGG
ncbi:hypothetical protein ACOSQ4_024149 [Xanthoceras sorbifolium]